MILDELFRNLDMTEATMTDYNCYDDKLEIKIRRLSVWSGKHQYPNGIRFDSAVLTFYGVHRWFRQDIKYLALMTENNFAPEVKMETTFINSTADDKQEFVVDGVLKMPYGNYYVRWTIYAQGFELRDGAVS